MESKRRAWTALAKGSAERAGFAEAPWPLRSWSFGLLGEVSPYVEIYFQQVTNTNAAPAVYLGMYAEAFELEWGDRLRRTSLPQLYEEPPPFMLFALNIDCLCPRPWPSNSSSDQELAEVRDYLDRAFEYAKGFPTSVDRLVAAIQADRLGEHNVWACRGHSVKVRGFVQWLHRVHGIDLGDRLLAGLSDETEPYDVDVMLGPL